MMRGRTGRVLMLLAALVVPAGLAFLLVVVPAAVAEPVDVVPLPPVTDTDQYAGACYSFYQEGSERPYLPMAYDAGSRWDRFDFSWPVIEPSNGVWNYGPHDALVGDLQDAGVDMIGILLWTPDWAATGESQGLEAPSLDRRPPGWYAPVHRDLPMAPMAISAASSPPQGLYLPWDDPNNHWGDYVHNVVSRFGDQVKMWEMWNEPEWSFFWTGSSTDYAQLLKVGYQATKAACSDCTVLFGGLHYWANPDYYRWVLSQLNDDPTAPENNYFFDVMSVHLYSRSANTYEIVNVIRDGMSVWNVGDHPIWLTETGAPVWNDSLVDPTPTEYDNAATQQEAAAYVVQSYANALASGVERYLFFRTHDADMGEYFGLIRNDHSLRPAYVAYQVATSYLISPTFVTREQDDPAMLVTLWGTPRGKVSIVWNESPTASMHALTATLDAATLVDRWGVTQTIAPANGIYTLTLPEATANLVSDPGDYIIGGDPLIVIESETSSEPPTSTVHPLPALMCALTFTVSWEGQDSESGILSYDVQVRDGESGEWTGWLEGTTATLGEFSGAYGHTYHFRSRATDGVGNRASWPVGVQAQTVITAPSTVHFVIGDFFADEDRDDEWDAGEIALTDVTQRLLDESGQDAVSPPVTGSFTATVCIAQSYQLRAISADHMRVLSFAWPRGGEVYTETYPALGLWPISRRYLPVVTREN